MSTRLLPLLLTIAWVLTTGTASAQSGVYVPGWNVPRSSFCPTGNCGVAPTSYVIPQSGNCPGGVCPPNRLGSYTPVKTCPTGNCNAANTCYGVNCPSTGSCANGLCRGTTAAPYPAVPRPPITDSRSLSAPKSYVPTTSYYAPVAPVAKSGAANNRGAVNSTAVRTRMFDSLNSPFYP